jgi:hypothetical protein
MKLHLITTILWEILEMSHYFLLLVGKFKEYESDGEQYFKDAKSVPATPL